MALRLLGPPFMAGRMPPDSPRFPASFTRHPRSASAFHFGDRFEPIENLASGSSLLDAASARNPSANVPIRTKLRRERSPTSGFESIRFHIHSNNQAGVGSGGT